VQGAASLLAQSADARETADPSSKGHQPRVTHTQILQGRIKHIRERSSSTKRKGSDHNSVPQKTARIEAEECPHLKVIDQNKEIFKKVLEKLADYSGNEPIICDSVRDLTVGFNGINEILGVLLAERLFPGPSPDPVVIVDTASTAQETTSAQHTEFVFPPKQKQVNPRKPLNQPPLGETGTWATAVRHGKQKQAQAQAQQSTMSSRWFQEEEIDSRQGKKMLSKEEVFVSGTLDTSLQSGPGTATLHELCHDLQQGYLQPGEYFG